MLFLPKIQLHRLEWKTFKIHFAYSLIEGIILGVLVLNEFVFLKSLGGTDTGVSVLFQFGVFVLTFSILLNEWVKRIKNTRRFLFVLAIFTRLPLFVTVFFPEMLFMSEYRPLYHYIFLAVFLAYYFANPIIYPIINHLLKTNYTHKNFSILYSWSTTANKIVMLVVTFLFGWLLDYNGDAYRYVFPVISLMSIFSVWLLSRIPGSNGTNPQRVEYGLWKSITNTITSMRQHMKNNKAFRDFEGAFMFYGFSFMGTVSVIAIYFQKELDLNYTSIAFYKNSYNIIAILLLPLFGKLMGKIDPRVFSAITFAALLFYLFFIALTEAFPWFFMINDVKIYYTLLIAMLNNGIFAATMSLLWSIGSAYFCKKDDVAEYQAIHLTLTGFRSFFAPILGLGIYKLLGFTATYSVGILLLLLAIAVSMKSYKKYGLRTDKNI